MRKIIKYMDKPLLIITVLLFVMGLIMIFSASNVSLSMNGGNPFSYFYKQAFILLLGLIGFILVGILHFSHILLYNDFKGSVANEKDNFFYTYNGYCAIFGGLQQISLRG